MGARIFVSDEECSTLKVCSDLVDLRTEQRLQFIDLTELVAERVRRSGVRQGLLCVQTRHTTTAIVVNENEPLLLEDMRRVLERLVPRDMRYRHNNLKLRTANVSANERENGDAHCKAMLLGTSESLNIVDGKIQLGEWQRVFLVELDGARKRTVSITVLGMSGDEPCV